MTTHGTKPGHLAWYSVAYAELRVGGKPKRE